MEAGNLLEPDKTNLSIPQSPISNLQSLISNL